MWKSNALYLSLEGATGLFLTVVRVPWSLSPNQLRVTVQPSSGAEWGDLCKIVPLQLGTTPVRLGTPLQAESSVGSQT